jgi:hypothetical protein
VALGGRRPPPTISGGPGGPGAAAAGDVKLAAGHAREGRVPAPSGASATTTRASRAVRIGYGPPPGTLPAVTRVRSTARELLPASANRELTERPTAHRSLDTTRRDCCGRPDPFGRSRRGPPGAPGPRTRRRRRVGERTPARSRAASHARGSGIVHMRAEHGASRRKRIRAHPGDSHSQHVAIICDGRLQADAQHPRKRA